MTMKTVLFSLLAVLILLSCMTNASRHSNIIVSVGDSIRSYKRVDFADTDLSKYRDVALSFHRWAASLSDTDRTLKHKLQELQKSEFPYLRDLYSKSISHYLTYKMGYDIEAYLPNLSIGTSGKYYSSPEGKYLLHYIVKSRQVINNGGYSFESIDVMPNKCRMLLKCDEFDKQYYRDMAYKIISNDMTIFRFSDIEYCSKERISGYYPKRYKHANYYGNATFDYAYIDSKLDTVL